LSHLFEEEMIGIIFMARDVLKENPGFRGIVEKFQEFCKKEKTQRKERNFQLIFEDRDEKKEQYIYNMGQFKKILSSVLYLDVIREQKEATYVHAVSSVAAFAASLTYFIITFYISKGFAIDSMPFIILISLGHVFKDRIKDIIKLIFNPRVLSRFPDQITQLKATSDKKLKSLGEIRENVFFTSREQVDPVVLSYRDKTRPPVYIPEESSEEILVYQKEININTKVIMESHSRTVNLADIMRFNIRKYLLKMDDPEQLIHFYKEEENRFSSTSGDRTYHLNMILRYSKFKEKKEVIKYE